MSSTSLKGFIPYIANVVGMTPAAIYERQRALVRAGLLSTEGGRGPGSGVRVTPESIAMLLISLLAAENLSDVEDQAKAVANLKSESDRCPLTGERTFARALAKVLKSDEIAEWVWRVSIVRGAGGAQATISAGKPDPKTRTFVFSKKHKSSDFGQRRGRLGSGLRKEASLVYPFVELAQAIREQAQAVR